MNTSCLHSWSSDRYIDWVLLDDGICVECFRILFNFLEPTRFQSSSIACASESGSEILLLVKTDDSSMCS